MIQTGSTLGLTYINNMNNDNINVINGHASLMRRDGSENFELDVLHRLALYV